MANKIVSALKNILGKDDEEEDLESLDPTEDNEEGDDLPPPEDDEESGDEEPADGEAEGSEIDQVEDQIETAEGAVEAAEADPEDPEAQAAAEAAVAAAQEAAEGADVPEDPKDAADKTLEDLSERLVPLSVWAQALLNPEADLFTTSTRLDVKHTMAIKTVQPSSFTSEITIEEVSGLERKITLRGPTLPHRGVSWGTQNRITTTWYSGNASEATQQVLGPIEPPTTFEGFWRRTMMGKSPALYSEGGNETKITTPWVLKELMEQICRQGARLRVTWVSSAQIDAFFSLVREGRAASIIFNHDTESDIGWRIEWAWMSRGVTQQKVVALRTGDPASEASQLVLDMNQLVDNFYTDIVINTDGQKKKKGQGVPNLTFDQLSNLADYPNNLVKGVTRDLQKMAKQFQNFTDLVNKVASIPGQVENTVTQAMDNMSTIAKQYSQTVSAIPAEKQSKTTNAADILRNVTLIGKSHDSVNGVTKQVNSVMLQFLKQYSRSGSSGGQATSQGTKNTTPSTVESLYIVRAGDTASSVSLQFYNTADHAIDILKSNSLPWTMTALPVGKVLVIPTLAG